jgi:hypothetical protein
LAANASPLHPPPKRALIAMRTAWGPPLDCLSCEVETWRLWTDGTGCAEVFARVDLVNGFPVRVKMPPSAVENCQSVKSPPMHGKPPKPRFEADCTICGEGCE